MEEELQETINLSLLEDYIRQLEEENNSLRSLLSGKQAGSNFRYRTSSMSII